MFITHCYQTDIGLTGLTQEVKNWISQGTRQLSNMKTCNVWTLPLGKPTFYPREFFVAKNKFITRI